MDAALEMRREDGVGRVGEVAELERGGARGAGAGGDGEGRGELPAFEGGGVRGRVGHDRGRDQRLVRGVREGGEGEEGEGPEEHV